jgi:hypothetical protein
VLVGWIVGPAALRAEPPDRAPLLDYAQDVLAFENWEGPPSPLQGQRVRVLATTVEVGTPAYFQERLYGTAYSHEKDLGLVTRWAGQTTQRIDSFLAAVVRLKGATSKLLQEARDVFAKAGERVVLFGELKGVGWRKGPQGVGGVLQTSNYYVLEVSRVERGWTLTSAADVLKCASTPGLAELVAAAAPAHAKDLRTEALRLLSAREAPAAAWQDALAVLGLVGTAEDAPAVAKSHAAKSPERLPAIVALLARLWASAPPEAVQAAMAGRSAELREALGRAFFAAWQTAWRAASYARREHAYPRACELLTKAIQAAPKSAELRAQRGFTYLLQRDRMNARADAAEALDLERGHAVAQQVRDWADKASDDELAALAAREGESAPAGGAR